jgi:hypothetical protein
VQVSRQRALLNPPLVDQGPRCARPPARVLASLRAAPPNGRGTVWGRLLRLRYRRRLDGLKDELGRGFGLGHERDV